MIFGLFTKNDVQTVASAVAEANGTTLAATVEKINASASDLEASASAKEKTAVETEASALQTHGDAIADAKEKYHQAVEAADSALNGKLDEAEALRNVATEEIKNATSKRKAINLLS